MSSRARSERRVRILERDQHRCHYCAAVATTVDHIVPASLGGRHRAVNLVAACDRCNQAKSNSATTCACRRCLTALRVAPAGAVA